MTYFLEMQLFDNKYERLPLSGHDLTRLVTAAEKREHRSFEHLRIVDEQGLTRWAEQMLLDNYHSAGRVVDLDWRLMDTGRQLDVYIATRLGWKSISDRYGDISGRNPESDKLEEIPRFSGRDMFDLLAPYPTWRLEFDRNSGYRCAIGDFTPSTWANSRGLAIARAWLAYPEFERLK